MTFVDLFGAAEKERLCTEVMRLEKMIVNARDIPRTTDEMIDDWLVYIRTALLNEDIELARRAIRHFVSKVVTEHGAGIISYTFSLLEKQNCGHLRRGEMDLRGLVPYPSHTLEFAIPLSNFAIAKQLNPDKAQLREQILAWYAQGMSYRQIAREVKLHFTRVQQIVQLARAKNLQ